MINEKHVNRYCREDISLIQNYDKAISDDTQMWDCHHRKETDEGLSVKQLKELGLLFDRPASELIFLTKSEHMSLHNKDKNHPMYGKHHSNKTKEKQSESMKGKHHSKETRNKQSESMIGKNKGKHRVYENEEHTKWHME